MVKRSGFRNFFRQTLAVPQLLVSGMVDLVLPPACRFCEGPLDAWPQNHLPLNELAVNGADSALGEKDSGHPLRYFCRDCFRVLSISEPMMRKACTRCGMPPAGVFPAKGGSHAGSVNLPCQNCRDDALDFDAVYSLWMYRDQVCDAIVAAKYAYNTPLADALGQQLGRRLSDALENEELGNDKLEDDILGNDRPSEVTFVPSHLFRQISRGGIGTQAIAEAVASQLKIPLTRRLKAVRPIAKQAWLDDDVRKENVHGAFAARKSYALGGSPDLDDRHILVVDDVLTTGATAGEVARVLKDAGAARVTIAVVSRAVRTR
jgi:predicted amidophosphoribosyltransferase